MGPSIQGPIVLEGITAVQRSNARKSTKKVIDDLPETWKKLLPVDQNNSD